MGMIAPLSPEEIARLSQAFRVAAPWPHVVIDRFLGPAGEAALDAFPDPAWPHWRRFEDAYQLDKRTCADIQVIPAPLAALIREACEPPFLEALEAITGVPRLIPDPYLEGGGLHASGPGGVLAPHTDFHVYERLQLYRALNILIYLNPDWREGDGGELELFAQGETAPSARVPPVIGRAVIFRTDDVSVHGFTNPVAAGTWRRSVALYYFTSRETAGFAGDTRTHWRTRAIPMTGARLAVHDGLILASRAISKLAYLIDPNMRRQEPPRV